MLLTRKKTQPDTVVLNDLIMINNERIACYKQAMAQTNNVHNDLKALFEEIILEAEGFKNELIAKLEEFNIDPKNTITLSGMIHMAWQELKATFIGTSHNATISFCIYNEEIALQSYGAALNLSNGAATGIRSMIERQHEMLNETYQLIKKSRQLLYYPSVRMMYFN